MRSGSVLPACLIFGCNLLCAIGLSAQPQTAILPQPSPAPLPVGAPVDLATTAQWRTHCGDGPAWADPAFDDSAWLKVDPRGPLPKDATPNTDAVCWYRAQVLVDPAMKNLGLTIDRAVLTEYDLFVNGNREGGVGNLPPHGKRYVRTTCVYPLGAPIPSTGKLAIAVRIRRYARFGPTTALPVLPFIATLGFVPDLTLVTQNRILIQLAYGLIGGPAIGLLVGTLALGLFVGQRKRREYFWLGIYWALVCGLRFGHVLCLRISNPGKPGRDDRTHLPEPHPGCFHRVLPRVPRASARLVDSHLRMLLRYPRRLANWAPWGKWTYTLLTNYPISCLRQEP